MKLLTVGAESVSDSAVCIWFAAPVRLPHRVLIRGVVLLQLDKPCLGDNPEKAAPFLKGREEE